LDNTVRSTKRTCLATARSIAPKELYPLDAAETYKEVSNSWPFEHRHEDRTWDVIPMPNLVIAHVNELGSNQPALMTFTHRHGRLVRDLEIPGVPPDEDDNEEQQLPALIDNAIEIPGVDVDGMKNPAPKNVEINDDLNNLEADQPLVEVETVEEEGVPVLQAPAPVLQAPAPASVKSTEPTRELRRST